MSPCSCWLSLEGGLLYAFVGPAAVIVLVSLIQQSISFFFSRWVGGSPTLRTKVSEKERPGALILECQVEEENFKAAEFWLENPGLGQTSRESATVSPNGSPRRMFTTTKPNKSRWSNDLQSGRRFSELAPQSAQSLYHAAAAAVPSKFEDISREQYSSSVVAGKLNQPSV